MPDQIGHPVFPHSKATKSQLFFSHKTFAAILDFEPLKIRIYFGFSDHRPSRWYEEGP